MSLLIDNLVFGYDYHNIILNGISLKTESNNIVAIVGASGCGKSTLLRLLCGILTKNNDNFFSGQIQIDGHSPKEYTKKGKVGFMFQEPALFPNLSVKKNISIPLKFSKNKNTSKIDVLIEKVGLSNFSEYLPKQLSGGMKTRVSLARTFLPEPSLLLLDEPFSSLDIKWKFILYKELELLRKEHSCTVILVTHDIQEALLLSNHILVLGSKGKVIKEMFIKKSLPRVFNENPLGELQNEYSDIRKTIMND